jgi:hypothetical protein
MVHYDSKLTPIEPTLAEGERKLVLITHDESTFYCNEGKKFFWLENGKRKILPKSKGQSLMISGFVCNCHGFMSNGTKHSYILFRAGIARDGWYTNADLIKQFKSCTELFKELHPDCDILMAFDNSMTHHAKADDALDAKRLNLSDGGKNVKPIRNGWYWKTIDGLQTRIEQPMQYEVPNVGLVQKGIKRILQERDEFYTLQENGQRGPEPKLICAWCKAGEHERDAAVAGGFTSERCCATYILSKQPDFQEQTEWLTEEVRAAGFTIIFYPKYHCELNYIEQIWGYLKSYHRRNCTYNYKELEEGLPVTIANHLPLQYVQKVYRSVFRFMSGYRIGMKGPLLDCAMKKYSGHRIIPPTVVENVNREFVKWNEDKLHGVKRKWSRVELEE